MASPSDHDAPPDAPAAAAGGDDAHGPEAEDAVDDDDGPDPVRLSILALVLVVLLGVWLWTALRPTPKPFYAEMPGVRLDGLTPAQREIVLKEANAMACDCGSPTCHYNVAECRHMEETACDTSLRLAGIIIRRVTGKEPEYTQAMPGGMPGAINPGTPAASPSVSASSSGAR